MEHSTLVPHSPLPEVPCALDCVALPHGLLHAAGPLSRLESSALLEVPDTDEAGQAPLFHRGAQQCPLGLGSALASWVMGCSGLRRMFLRVPGGADLTLALPIPLCHPCLSQL